MSAPMDQAVIAAGRTHQRPASLESAPGGARMRACRAATAEARVRAVQRVIAVMRERYAESLSLDELSGIAISSPFHFSRVFREVTGLPPGQFLAAIRLQVAKQLLLTTRRKVTNICFDVGYSSLGTFSTHFAQYVGAPPSRFRRLVRMPSADRTLPPPAARESSVCQGTGRVYGRIHAAEGDSASGSAIIGLFAGRLPRGRPHACTVATIGSDFLIENVAAGCYHLFSMADSTSTNDVAICLGESVRLGHCGPIHVRPGDDTGPIDLEVRWPRDTDPPLLIALPVLMNERG
jgi:AraC family transcriptional regulator